MVFTSLSGGNTLHVLSRRLGVALTGCVAAAALAVRMAGQADAATSTVLLHTQTTIPKLLTDNPSGVVTMEPAPLGGNRNQRWIKTDTSNGFGTYASVSSIDAGKPRCLTGRGLQGFPVVTAARACPAPASSSGDSASAATSSCASTDSSRGWTRPTTGAC